MRTNLFVTSTSLLNKEKQRLVNLCNKIQLYSNIIYPNILFNQNKDVSEYIANLEPCKIDIMFDILDEIVYLLNKYQHKEILWKKIFISNIETVLADKLKNNLNFILDWYLGFCNYDIDTMRKYIACIYLEKYIGRFLLSWCNHNPINLEELISDINKIYYNTDTHNEVLKIEPQLDVCKSICAVKEIQKLVNEHIALEVTVDNHKPKYLRQMKYSLNNIVLIMIFKILIQLKCLSDNPFSNQHYYYATFKIFSNYMPLDIVFNIINDYQIPQQSKQ